MSKKALKGPAKIIQADASVRLLSVAAAAAAAQRRPPASAAFRLHFLGLLNKPKGFPLFFPLRRGVDAHRAETQLVQNVKIARINAAVCLDHQLRRTNTQHTAAAGRTPFAHMNQRVKPSNGNIFPAHTDMLQLESRGARGRNTATS